MGTLDEPFRCGPVDPTAAVRFPWRRSATEAPALVLLSTSQTLTLLVCTANFLGLARVLFFGASTTARAKDRSRRSLASIKLRSA
ncbi:hypothetical protein G6F31_020441 [Rhizopus arrhizus]|nr:hypothetical protein G6F31_020441 [Rhizopus arrhizus]